MKLNFKKWFIKETGAGAGVPYIGQSPGPRGSGLSWQGAAGNGQLHNAIQAKKKKKKLI